MVDPALVAVGLAIAFLGTDAVGHAVGWVERHRGRADPTDDGSGGVRSDLLKWGVAGALVAYVLLVEGKPLSSIGAEPMAPGPFVAWIVGGFVLTYGVSMAAYLAWNRLGLTAPDGFVEDQLERPVAARVVTAVTAGVTESILFHGYPIERLSALLGSLPLAGFVALVAFTVGHYVGNDVFSVQETAFIGITATGVTVLYVLTGNLFVVIVVHAMVDGVSLLAPELADDPGEDGTVEAAE